MDNKKLAICAIALGTHELMKAGIETVDQRYIRINNRINQAILEGRREEEMLLRLKPPLESDNINHNDKLDNDELEASRHRSRLCFGVMNPSKW